MSLSHVLRNVAHLAQDVGSEDELDEQLELAAAALQSAVIDAVADGLSDVAMAAIDSGENIVEAALAVGGYADAIRPYLLAVLA